MSRKPTEFNDWPKNLPITFGPYRAVITHVTDGDTCDVLVDQGFNSYRYLTVRIMGIDAPEIFRGDDAEKTLGKAAKEYLATLAPPGTPCLIHTDKDRQSFGRYSASILLFNGTDVASAMVRADHAVWSKW